MVWRPALGAASQKMHQEGASAWETKVVICHWVFNGLATRTWRGLAETAPRVGLSMGSKSIEFPIGFSMVWRPALGAASQKMPRVGPSMGNKNIEFPLVLHCFGDPHLARLRRKCT